MHPKYVIRREKNIKGTNKKGNTISRNHRNPQKSPKTVGKLFYIILISITPILRIGDQVLTFDVFWPKHLQEVRSTVYIHVQSI